MSEFSYRAYHDAPVGMFHRNGFVYVVTQQGRVWRYDLIADRWEQKTLVPDTPADGLTHTKE